MSYEIDGNIVMNVEEVKTDVQTATVKTYYDRLYHLQVTTDKTTITANGMDVATITAQVYDYQNNIVTDQNPVITFTLNGVTQDVQSVNGQASTTVTATAAGSLTMTANVTDYRGGEVTINAQ